MTQKTVLVTGAAKYWGDRITYQLLQNDDYRVIGIDTETPQPLNPKLNFIQADLRTDALAKLLQEHQVSTVCHLDCPPNYQQKAVHGSLLGAAKLLSACAEAGVAQIIVKSSTAIYGAQASNPAFLAEEYPLPTGLPSPAANYYSQLETLCRRHHNQFNLPNLTILRFANIVGNKADSPMTRFLAQTLPRTLLGFNPMVQLIHEDDVAAAILHAIDTDFVETVNIGAENVLPLSQIIALTGKTHVPVPLPMAYLRTKIDTGQTEFPIYPDYLRYRCVANLTRMTDDFGFTPNFSAEDAVRSFAEQSYFRHLSADAAAHVKTIKRIWAQLKKETP